MSQADPLAGIAHNRLIPLIVGFDPQTAVATADALIAGGLDVLEVVLRTDAALDCIRELQSLGDRAVIGAGTVLNADQANAAIEAGARFIVSPGLDADVVAVAQNHGLPVFPGIATAGEAQRAWNLGLRVVKFFPAALAGGLPMLKALASVFRGLRFIPTGGVSAANLGDFLAQPSVLACGGSWLTPGWAIEQGDFDVITKLAGEALAIARQTES